MAASKLELVSRYFEVHRIETLNDYLLDRTDNGFSPEQIAKQVYADTQTIVDVDGRTIRRWINTLTEQTVA